MRTAIDSSILFLLRKGESGYASWLRALIQARKQGSLLICEIVYSEAACDFDQQSDLDQFLATLGIKYDPIEPSTAYAAGEIFVRYRQHGGPRQHLIPDFLVGAHALHQADRLAAIDRGYLRNYFGALPLLSIEDR